MISFEPIGKIVSEIEDPKKLEIACEQGLNCKIKSKIILNSDLERGLKGIEKFSHIFVIYYLHKVEHIEVLTSPVPSSIKCDKKVGIFASRAQYRPNPIAVRLVKLLRIKNNEIFVEGLDGINGSPVLDIKPYVPGFDRPESFKIADWYTWFDE